MIDRDQRVQTSKMSWVYYYSIVTVAYTTVLHISKLLRVNQMSSSQKEKKTCF